MNVARARPQQVLEEEDYHHLQKGTKLALICGPGLFNTHLAQTKSNPKLKLGGDNFRLFAHADVWGRLKDRGHAWEVSIRPVRYPSLARIVTSIGLVSRACERTCRGKMEIFQAWLYSLKGRETALHQNH